MLKEICTIINEGTKIKNVGKLEDFKVTEITLNEIKEVSKDKGILEPDIETVKNFSLESIIEINKEKIEQLNETSEFMPLTEYEKKEIQERTGMTDANIEKCTINDEDIIRLKCINEEYKGKNHPETGIPYVEKIVDINGVKIQVVVPEFKSMININLPDELKMASESKQFQYLNQKLNEEIKSNPNFRSQFNDRQSKRIERGLKPEGFTWHHNEECCKMQLVKFDTHSQTRHTGGNSIWSAGT